MTVKKLLYFNVYVEEVNTYCVTEEQITHINKTQDTNFDIDNLSLTDIEELYSYMGYSDIVGSESVFTDVRDDFEVIQNEDLTL